jgi:hypothetical protein
LNNSKKDAENEVYNVGDRKIKEEMKKCHVGPSAHGS